MYTVQCGCSRTILRLGTTGILKTKIFKYEIFSLKIHSFVRLALKEMLRLSLHLVVEIHWFDRIQEHRNLISCREEVDDALFNQNAIKSPRKPF